MFNKLLVLPFFLITSFGLSTPVFASLVLDTYSSGTATPGTIGGYTMTDFDFLGSNSPASTNSVDSPLSGVLNFLDDNDTLLNMNHNTADSLSWWNNGETSGDYDVYTTDVHEITIELPKNTLAFSFNVGANLSSTGNNAWITATELDGNGIGSQYWFNVNKNNTPGFGISVDNSSGSCSYLTSITIEPDYWGLGNFSINQGSCATVPEPSSLLLMSGGFLGLFGSMVARRKRKVG